MGKTLTISDLDNQLISRTLEVQQAELSTVFRVATPHVKWRLVVAETSGNAGLFVKVIFAGPDNEYTQEFNVNPNGAEEISGSGACNIQIAGASGNATARCELTDPLSYQSVYSRTPGYATVVTWTDVGNNAGYPPDFMNYLMLWVSGTFDLRVNDISGFTVATYTNLNPNDFIRFGTMIPVSKRQKFQIQSAGGVGAVTYRATWFNRH